MTKRDPSSTPLSTEPYKGVRDFYPADWAKLDYIFGSVRTLLRRNGFEEYQASPMERAELYESKTSEEIVSEQTYTFTDRGDRRVTLRPEMTPSLARMVAGKQRELVYPLRWFSIGNRFRYERPQKGRLREFYQVDVDIIGLPGSKGEGEAIVRAHQILQGFGATNNDFEIRINSRALVNAACAALSLTDVEVNAYIALVDRKEKMDAAAFEEARIPYRRSGTDPLELIEANTNEVVVAERAELDALMASLKVQGITNVVFSPTLMRGFLYYTGTVFEFFDTNPANARALFGGGRYDGLVSLFGGDPLPAVGFAFGDVTLIDFLEAHNLMPHLTGAPDLFVGTPSESDIPAAHAFADTLRKDGINVLVNMLEKGLGDQVKEAVRRTIPFFLAYGANEATGGTVSLKVLAESREEALAKDAVAHFITTHR